MDGSKTGDVTRAFLRNPATAGWSAFVEHYGRTIYRWCTECWRLDPNDAADLTQIVLTKLFEKMRSPSACPWDPAKGRFHAWLKTVARNAWRNAVAKRPTVGHDADSVRQMLDDQSAGEDFVEVLALKELLQTARQRAQRRVKESEWAAFHLRIENRLKAHAAARQLRVTAETVHNYTSHVRKIFREELQALEAASATGAENGK